MSKKVKVFVIVGAVVLAALLIRMFFNQRISSVEDLQNYMKTFGVFGPLVLTLIQIGRAHV